MRVMGELPPHSARQDVLELEDQLSELRRRQWTLILWGPRESPALMGAMFQWRDCADVLLVRNDRQASGYRIPTVHGGEVFNPESVLYQYHQSPLWTLRAILSLPHPGMSSAPIGIERPKYPECFIPDDLPNPVLIRPLSTCPRAGQ